MSLENWWYLVAHIIAVFNCERCLLSEHQNHFDVDQTPSNNYQRFEIYI